MGDGDLGKDDRWSGGMGTSHREIEFKTYVLIAQEVSLYLLQQAIYKLLLYKWHADFF